MKAASAILILVLLCCCAAPVEARPPRSELAIELLFSGDARDTSGKRNHGVVDGAVLTADRFGREDEAYYFDGTSSIAVSPPPTLSDQALTVSVWVRYDSSDFAWWNNAILCQDNGDDASNHRIIQLSTNWRHICWHRMTFGPDARSPVFLDPGVWYHIAVVYDGRHHRLYVDGLLHDTREGELASHPEEPLYVGRKGSDESDFTFRGAIDDVRIYNQALPPMDIAQLYQER